MAKVTAACSSLPSCPQQAPLSTSHQQAVFKHQTELHQGNCFHIKLAWAAQNLSMFTRNRPQNYQLPRTLIFR